MAELFKKEFTMKVGLSALQWGETPGNLRFSLFNGDSKMAIGSLSLGGSAAYKLQERIATEGMQSARVVRNERSGEYVLLQLMAEDGWVNWGTALGNSKKETPTVLVDGISLPVGRGRVDVSQNEAVQ